MKSRRARVQNYRSILDTGVFEIEDIKTILVGPNEAGKTVVLRALQTLNPSDGINTFNALRDYPRSLYADLAEGRKKAEDILVVTGWFDLDEDDLEALPKKYQDKTPQYTVYRYLNNKMVRVLQNGPSCPTYGELKSGLNKILADYRETRDEERYKLIAQSLLSIVKDLKSDTYVYGKLAEEIRDWLKEIEELPQSSNDEIASNFHAVSASLDVWDDHVLVMDKIHERLPKFILYSNIFRVKPTIHLDHLATRLESGVMDDDQYDYGNSCLLKLLGFDARELSTLGKAPEPREGDLKSMERYRDQLDRRKYQLNAASRKLSAEINQIWSSEHENSQPIKLRVTADGQYLKVVIEDEDGNEVELDQRSEGFRWIVSFFIVFLSETSGKHQNAILLIDEPGVSLHALKQRDFRKTIGRLAASNQTICTTHSPFMVGPDELDLVRVVEMESKNLGTVVHSSITSTDPAALMPLQAALGYDLAQSLFAQQRNLVLEGLTDLWYVEATAALIHEDVALNPKIALVSAGAASKVVYFATILAANKLKVAALLDSDAAGDQAAKQETLVHRLGSKKILRTADFLKGQIAKAEIEDLLRVTLSHILKEKVNIDVIQEIQSSPSRSFVSIVHQANGGEDFKYNLAKHFVRWTRDHDKSSLHPGELSAWTDLVSTINKVLK